MAAPEATTPALLVADSDGTRTITLNRPERRNALSHGLMLQLSALLDETAVDSSVRVVVIAAAGAAFSAGHDLSEMTAAARSRTPSCSASAPS